MKTEKQVQAVLKKCERVSARGMDYASKHCPFGDTDFCTAGCKRKQMLKWVLEPSSKPSTEK